MSFAIFVIRKDPGGRFLPPPRGARLNSDAPVKKHNIRSAMMHPSDSPISSEVVPGAVQVTSLTSIPSQIPTVDDILFAEVGQAPFGALNRHPIRCSRGCGKSPRGAAPALVVHGTDETGPFALRARVERTGKVSRVVDLGDGVHLVDLLEGIERFC